MPVGGPAQRISSRLVCRGKPEEGGRRVEVAHSDYPK